MWSDADAHHREELSERTVTMLEQNMALTQQVEQLSEQVRQLTQEIHARIVGTPA